MSNSKIPKKQTGSKKKLSAFAYKAKTPIITDTLCTQTQWWVTVDKNSRRAWTVALRDRGEGQESGSRYSHDLYVERLLFFKEWSNTAQGVIQSVKGKDKCQIREAGDQKIIFLHFHSSLLCFFSGMSDAAIMELNLPTGIPIVYELDADLKPIKPMSFLGDEETVKKAMEAVAAQGKAKK